VIHRFKIDENLPTEVAQVLAVAGHDATTVLDQNLGGEADSQISAICLAEGRVILTLDLDFADVRSYPPDEYAGIIVLRLSLQDKQSVIAIAQKLVVLLEHEPSSGKLWIVDETRVRIRD